MMASSLLLLPQIHQLNSAAALPLTSTEAAAINESIDNNATSSPTNVSSCLYTFDSGAFLLARFILVCVLMSSICIFGIYGNSVIVLVLSRRRMRSSTSWYLLVLAFVDTLVMVCTVLLYVVELVYDYTKNFKLYVTWFSYVRLVYLFSHISQDASVYLTIAATVERFMCLWFNHRGQILCAEHKAFYWMLLIAPFLLGMTLTKYWELDVIYQPECKGLFGFANLRESRLLRNKTYQTVHSVYLSSILFIFLPFFILATLNTLIFLKIRRQHNKLQQQRADMSEDDRRNSKKFGFASIWIKRRKAKSKRNREATIVLFGVALVFLICNAPSVVISITEHIDKSYLRMRPKLYALSRDIINLLTVVNSSANFVIYLVCGGEFRKELQRLSGCSGDKSWLRPVVTQVQGWVTCRRSSTGLNKGHLSPVSTPNIISIMPTINKSSSENSNHQVALKLPSLCDLNGLAPPSYVSGSEDFEMPVTLGSSPSGETDALLTIAAPKRNKTACRIAASRQTCNGSVHNAKKYIEHQSIPASHVYYLDENGITV